MTEDQLRQAKRLIARGMRQREAARQVGVAESTLRYHLEKGKWAPVQRPVQRVGTGAESMHRTGAVQALDTGAVQRLDRLEGEVQGLMQIVRRERATTQQREELTWRRTQFFLQLWKEFNADLSLRACIRMVDPGDEDPHLASFFHTNPTQLPNDQADLRDHFDRYFDFLMSLAHCEKEGLLSLRELTYFGWHDERILASKTLTAYCRDEGFDEVVLLAEKMKNREGWV